MHFCRDAWHKLDSPRATLLVVLGLYLVFFWTRLDMFGGDVSRFVVAGDLFVAAADAPSNLAILSDSDGYDGQFYYRLALTPFTSDMVSHGVSFDGGPAYRQQRIMYPLLAYLASLGQPLLAPMALVGVNLLSAALLGWLAGQLAQQYGCHALTGLGLALYPGLLLVFDRDLGELTEAMFLSLTILALARQRHGLATLGMCLALLTKETSLGLAVAAVPVTVWAWMRRADDPARAAAPRWHFWAAPGALYLAYQALLRHRWGVASLTSTTIKYNVSAPGVNGRWPAFFEALARYFPRHNLAAVEMLALAAFGAVVLVAVWKSRATLHLKLAFLGYLALGLVIRHYWGGDWAFLRAVSEYWLIGGVILLAWRKDLAALYALGATVSWCLLALNVVLYR